MSRKEDDMVPLQPYDQNRVPPLGSEGIENPSLEREARKAPDGGVDGWRRSAQTIKYANMFHLTKMKEKLKRIDYVLVYSRKTPDEETDPDDREELKKRIKLRHKFEAALVEERIQIQADNHGEYVYMKLHVPFERLCAEAENVKLEMPLYGCEIYPEGKPSWWDKFKEKYLETDNEVDFVSAPFHMDHLHIYDGHENPDTFFRPALRCYLAHHILINMDIRSRMEEEEDPMAKKGLPYLRMKKVYKDAFVLHDETIEDPYELDELEEKMAEKGGKLTKDDKLKRRSTKSLIMEDTRESLDKTWTKFFKYQPLWKIRNYFGEKIGLYFAWSGTLITTLWLPTLFGICVFFYGLYLSIDRHLNGSSTNTTTVNDTAAAAVKRAVDDSISIVKESFDNEVTPYFALVICLWGTIFLEVWKRRNATLAYEWDVDSFEETEPDRPEFYGTKKKPDPVTMEETWYYPIKNQLVKFTASASALILMVCLVFISVGSVIVYRVIMSVDYCGSASAVNCLLFTTVVSSVLNAVSILILGKIYDKLAVVLTNWENHRTQTQYDDALILKLFAFQFANSYTSLFYIAFFRREGTFSNGIFDLGVQYQDTCGDDNNCMAMLSFQVLVLMLAKPVPKFLKDVIVVWLLGKWKKRKFCRKKTSKVNEEDAASVPTMSYVQREESKPDLGDFTLGEYTEKVIVYGFLMLFAASFPLAPLIALLINLVDIKIDAKRMIWMYKRPVARIAQDIGMWYNILQFLNICGVVSNAFLIAYTSSWGAKYNATEKLWIVIIFENVVMAIKLILMAVVTDVPREVRLSMKREKYQVRRIFEKANELKYNGKPRLSERVGFQDIAEEDDDTNTLPAITTSGHSMVGAPAPPMYDEEEVRKRRKKKKRIGDDDHASNDLADLSADHEHAPSQFPHKLAPLKPPPARPSVRGGVSLIAAGLNPGSTLPIPTALGSRQRYQHVDKTVSPNETINANSNNPFTDFLPSEPYSSPVKLSDGTPVEALVTSRDPFPRFPGLGNPSGSAQSLPPTDLSKSLPANVFSSGRGHRPAKSVSFNLGPTDSEVLASSDGAAYLDSSGGVRGQQPSLNPPPDGSSGGSYLSTHTAQFKAPTEDENKSESFA